jgi:hypothetical protein
LRATGSDRLRRAASGREINVRAQWLAVLALLSTPLWGGEVYRSIDEAGNVIYSDRPQGARVEKVYVAVPRPARGPVPTQVSRRPSTAEAAQPAGENAQVVPVEPTPEEARAERTANCRIANERLQRYLVSHRLYRTLPNGEREYLADAEIDEARAKAAADVEQWCD